VGGTDNRNAHSSIDEATYHRVRTFPLVGKSQGESLEEFSGFLPDEAISQDDKRSKELVLFKTGLLVLFLFLSLLRGKDFVRIS
jgi:hypothetical protein